MLRVAPVRKLVGELRPPSDKSLTHRAFMAAAMATSPSRICEPLMGEDCLATLRCLEAMGMRWHEAQGAITIEPAPEWRTPPAPLDCGNSGTTMRLLAGLIASRPIEATLTGDASLSSRPMGRIADPLRQMGAEVAGDRPPIHIQGRADLDGIDYVSPVASAQVKSCVLLAGLRASGPSSVTEPSSSRDHTERILRALGANLQVQGLTVRLEPGASWAGFETRVPADISSAAFWLVAATLVPGAELVLRDIGLNPTRTGILDVLAATSANVQKADASEVMGEPRGTLVARHGGERKPFVIDGPLVPRLIDEIPVLAVMATQLEGESRITGAGELRVKESDRIETVAAGLRAMGARVETFADGMAVEGPVRLQGARIQAYHDHRIAMAFAVAGLIAEGETHIEGAEVIATSYPEFEADLRRLTH